MNRIGGRAKWGKEARLTTSTRVNWGGTGTGTWIRRIRGWTMIRGGERQSIHRTGGIGGRAKRGKEARFTGSNRFEWERAVSSE
jgi:hypothetical protein